MKWNGVSLRFSQHQCEEAPISVRRNRLPCGKSAVFHPGQAIIVSLPHQIFDPVEEGNLPSDFLPFFLRELRRIQFIAEGTGHGDRSSGPEGCRPAGLMIGTGRHMRTDC